MPISTMRANALVRKEDGMNPDETGQVLSLLMSGTLHVEEGGRLLSAWAERGETGAELASVVRYLKGRSIDVSTSRDAIDVCGTGGTGLTRYNISTTSAFVLAAAGIPVAKHGNRGSQRPNGSFDLLDALNVPFELGPARLAQLQDDTGVCFLFARAHHPAVGAVVNYRKAAGCRTVFNLAGPLANPAKLRCQLIGVADQALLPVIADALRELSMPEALVVWGEPGIDEISVAGPTNWIRISGDKSSEGTFEPSAKKPVAYDELPGGDAVDNAEVFKALLEGNETGPLLDMLCVNAGAAIDLWEGRQPEVDGSGAKLARKLIKNGKVLAAFEKHRQSALSLM